MRWEPNDQRDVFIKSIPGYNMPLSFDLNSSMRTHVIDGILADTSNANLAADMEYLESLFRTGQLVWVDATDQYPSLCSFGKIAKLQGPAIDTSKGQFVATFTMEFWSVPSWGTILFNPWKQTGFKFRDIDGVGAEYMLDPIQMHSNFTINEINQSSPFTASWEFILENQNPFTNVTSKQYANCDSLGSGTASPTNPIAVNGGGYYTSFDSISIDMTNFKEGTGSLKGTKSSPVASTVYSTAYDFGTSGINLSSYDRLRIWFMCDQTGQTYYALVLWDTNGKTRNWEFTLQSANTWMNMEVALASYSNDTGLSLGSVRYIGVFVETANTPPSSINLWIDDIRVETGYITHCEDTSGWNLAVGGDSGGSVSTDATICKNSYSGIGAVSLPAGASSETSSLAALKYTSTSSSSGQAGARFVFPVANWNISSYDFVLVWFRCDFGGNATGNIVAYIGDQSITDYWNWNYDNLNANQWYRLVVPIRNPNGTTGAPTLSSIGFFQINTFGKASSSTNSWYDEIAFDIGNYAYMEMMLPDNLLNHQIQIETWNGSAYALAEEFGTTGWLNDGSANNFTLDGSEFDQIYAAGQSHYMELYGPAPISTSKLGMVGSGAVSPKTYSAVYGTNLRTIIAIKMPPMTSDSVSGNYPSNDLSGFQAINKVRFKIVIYFPNDDTTYSGFNSL